MRLVLFDRTDRSIEIIPISEEEYMEYGGIDGFDVSVFLSHRRHFTDNIGWMICDDEIPVYLENTPIPFIYL